jgi:tRNA(Ile)-lysidine synthase
MLSESFLDFIKQERLFQKNEHLLLAISGGLDSVVLAHLLKLNQFNFSLAHMNFQLRGLESEEDEKFVRELADELGVKVFVKKIKIQQGAGSTQIQARNLRYRWFDELLKNHNFDKLLTAHHANDLLETALLNLSRGTGIKGLRSILPLQNKIARPLLFADKVELERFAKEGSVQWREDSSNASDHYTRNKIRHHVIPQLVSLNPNLTSVFQQTALRLRATEDAWDEKLKAVAKEFFNHKGKILEIDKTLLNNPHAIVYLSELLGEYGFGLLQLQSFDFSRVGAQLLSSEYILSIDRESILITKVNEEGLYSFFPKKINVDEKSLKTPFGVMKWEFIDKEELKYEDNSDVSYVDFDSLEFPIEVDLWQEGDKIQPLGMKGKKKISDILIDQKIPLPRKKQALVLKSGGEIVWLIGHKFSDLFKVNNNTKKILRFENHENIKSI